MIFIWEFSHNKVQSRWRLDVLMSQGLSLPLKIDNLVILDLRMSVFLVGVLAYLFSKQKQSKFSSVKDYLRLLYGINDLMHSQVK